VTNWDKQSPRRKKKIPNRKTTASSSDAGQMNCNNEFMTIKDMHSCPDRLGLSSLLLSRRLVEYFFSTNKSTCKMGTLHPDKAAITSEHLSRSCHAFLV